MARTIYTFPRCPLARLTQPVAFTETLPSHLGGPKIWIKRPRCTGLSTNGDKVRKLEFPMGEALASDFRFVAAHGAAQCRVAALGAAQCSHARQTAAQAAG